MRGTTGDGATGCSGSTQRGSMQRGAWRLAPLLLVVLAACATPPAAPPTPTFDAEAAVAAIRAAGVAADSELVVKPLSDPDVEDLRQQARQWLAQRRYADAAAALDRALELDPDDPELMQERAEVALLLREPEAAARLARRAIEIGAEVGPLCRRHWETIAQVRAIRAPPPADSATVEAGGTAAADVVSSVAEARRQRDACTVAAPPRY